mgnify:CR=1 FL=1
MLKKIRNSKGFTLAEMLVVIAIIAIISAISVGGLLNHIKSLRQMKLDTTARTIYTAAQNRLTELYSSGNTEWNTASFESGDSDLKAKAVTEKPSDWGEESDFSKAHLYAVISDDTGMSGTSNDYTKRALLPEGAINEELYGHNWVVEFDPDNGYVYAVFYSEELDTSEFYTNDVDANFDTAKMTIVRANRESRLKNFNAKVGYYGGNISVNEKYDVTDISNYITIEDGEELKISFSVSVPIMYKKDYIDYTVSFTGMVSGAVQSYKFEGLKRNTSFRAASLVLDSLNDKAGDSFYANFCDPYRNFKDLPHLGVFNRSSFEASCILKNGDMIPGENVRVSFTAKVRDNEIAKSVTAEEIFNGLFDNDKKNDMGADRSNNEAVAYVRNGRHLQNLDKETSGVNGGKSTGTAGNRLSFTSAVQTDDIEFAAEGDGTWINAYGYRPFKPIVNQELKSYDGGTNKKSARAKIRNLIAGDVKGTDRNAGTGKVDKGTEIAETANAGLFGTFYGDKLKGVTLTGTVAHGTDNAGALAASIESTKKVTIEDCRAYLLNADVTALIGEIDKDSNATLTDRNSKIAAHALITSDSGNAGGLIGNANCDLEFTKSFASTVINGNRDNGQASAAADKNNAGGLLGHTSGNINVSSSYADSYIAGVRIGGMAGFTGSKSIIRGSYTAGFALSTKETKSVAGFMLNAEPKSDDMNRVTGSYTIFDTGSGTARYHISNKEREATRCFVDAVYYSNSSNHNEGVHGATALNKSSELKKPASDNDSPIAKMKAAGASFRFKQSETTAYNLGDNMALKTYDYPQIDGLWHYGDWIEKEVEPGTLVYYEKYKDGSWGFVSASGITTLYAKTTADNYVVDDGYALIYAEDAVSDAQKNVKVYFNTTDTTGSATVEPAGNATVVNIANGGGNTGWKKAIFRPIGKAIDNAGLKDDGTMEPQANMADFYLPISIVTADKTDRYYFNPYFAKTVVRVTEFGDASKPVFSTDASDKSIISVRTPRQLYLMSRSYSEYAAKTEGCEFTQELDLDYTKYDWDNCGVLKTILGTKDESVSTAEFELNRDKSIYLDISKLQPSIGSEAVPFAAEYNGGCHTISGIAIDNKDAGTGNMSAGLFGTVRGRLENIAFTADYSEKSKSNLAINNEFSIRGNGNKAYIGGLAGHLTQSGSINNCAVAGFVFNSYAYDHAILYTGGLAGYNEGRISDSSADMPLIRMRTNEGSNAAAGSFVGMNSGNIEECYGISYINIGRSASDSIGKVYLGGFAGNNTGNIEASYCAATSTSENIDDNKINGFAPEGRGSLQDCLYLDGGNYHYVDNVYAYNVGDENNKQLGNVSGGTLVDLIDPEKSSTVRLSDAFGKAVSSFNCGRTRNKIGGSEADPAVYPYPAIVSDAEGNKVHYGEWPVDSGYANVGFVYWEHEEGGANRGYHYYIIDGAGEVHSTICSAHDDGGVITDYGYGYYYAETDNSGNKLTVTSDWKNINVYKDKDEDEGFASAKRFDNAETALNKQFSNAYVFVLYKTTQVSDEAGKSNHAKSDKGMFLTNHTYNVGTTDITKGGAYAVCELNITGGGTAAVSMLRYVFTPMFAKSMILHSYSEGGSSTATDINYPGSDNGDKYESDKKEHDNGQLTSTETGENINILEYMKNGLPFEIRSVSQLQNINWRNDTYDALTTVRESDAITQSRYSYLRWYTPSTSDADIPSNDKHNFYWKQTHDINASAVKDFTPIGGLFDTKKTVVWSNPYSSPYIAYFNGDYNGASYKIQNIKIDSVGQTVGLFGTTICAKLRNIIMYSDSQSNKIQTNVEGKNWYCLGGLVGFAAKGTVENCSVAGYTIQDNRKYSGAADADIGGLAGFCATNIVKCSSVNDIVINRTYDNADGYTNSGNVFVGGMSGVCPGIIQDSYCGGSIGSTSATNGEIKIYVGGFIGGEWFRASGLQRLTGYRALERRPEDAEYSLPEPVIKNCYSFINLPTAGEKRIIIVAPLAAIGNLDEGSAAKPVTIKVINSYYYNVFANKAKSLETKQIQGIDNFKYIDSNGYTISKDYLDTVMGLSYEQMASTAADGMLGKFNSGGSTSFGTVTTTENGGMAINGKYSFPGSDNELKGTNYPFPTVITQEDPFDSDKTVNVHYGKWPKGTDIYSDASTVSLDLLSGSSGKDDYWTEASVKYYDQSSVKAMDTVPSLSFASSSSNTSEYVEASLTATTVDKDSAGNDVTVPQYYKLKLNALKEGYDTISVSYTVGAATYTTKLSIAVTADLTIKIQPIDTTNSQPKVGETVSYKAEVYDRNNTKITGLTTANWGALSNTPAVASVDKDQLAMDADGSYIIPVTGNSVGTAMLNVTVKGLRSKSPNAAEIPARSASKRLNVTDKDATSAAALFYVNDERIDTELDHPVAVDSGTSIGSDGTSAANLNYWSSAVVSDQGLNAGRTFTGWITEDGTGISAASVLGSTTRLNASWQCTEVSFVDNGSVMGRLYYYAGNFYTDRSLSERAESAPQPKVHNRADEFKGYWTGAALSGARVSLADGTLIANAFDNIADENTAHINVYAGFGAATGNAESTHETAVQEEAAQSAENESETEEVGGADSTEHQSEATSQSESESETAAGSQVAPRIIYHQSADGSKS